MVLDELLQEIKAQGDTKAEIQRFVDAFSKVLDVFDKLKTDNATEMAQHRALVTEAARQMNERVANIKDGESPKEEQLLALIKPLIPKPIEPDHNYIADLAADRALERIKLPEQKELILDPIMIRDKLHSLAELPEEERLDASAMKPVRMDKDDQKVTRVVSNHGPLYSLIDVNVGGVTNGQVLQWNGTQWVNATVSGGSGFQVPSSGAINGVNATFVWATAPNVIVVDQGRAMQKTSSDGTQNWSGTTTTVLTIAPTFDVYSTN